MAIDFTKYGTPIEPTEKGAVDFSKYGTPVGEGDIATKTKKPSVIKEFAKGLVSAPLTMLARPVQAGAALLGAKSEDIDRISSKISGGLIAPTPQNLGDVKKDIGRGVQTVALGLGPVSGGAAFGAGASLEQGNDLFSKETAAQTLLGAGLGKGLGIIGKPLLNATGKVVGKITPQVIKDVAAQGTKAVEEFATRHQILPEEMSKVLNTVPGKVETAINKPLDAAGALIKKPFVKTPESIIKAREQELAAIDKNYANMRKASGFSKDEGVSSRRRIASTDVLVDAVDENGLIRTENAVKQYEAQTLDRAEGVVRKNLERLGETVDIKTVEKKLIDQINKSGLEGADLKNALNKIKGDIAGYKLRAKNGRIPLTLLHDAKVSQYKQINFQTPPETSTYRKSVARALKEIVEENTKFNADEVNKEIGKYLEDVAFLKRLDGKRVKGGKLGKYFAQISGNIIGGTAGAAIGGPAGSAVGTILGGELGGRIKGSLLQRTLGGKTGYVAPKNPIIEKAIKLSKTPYENNLGNLKTKYSTTATPSKSSITKTIPKLSPKSKISLGKGNLKKFERADGLSKVDTAIETKAFDKIAKSEDKILQKYYSSNRLDPKDSSSPVVVNADNFRPDFIEEGYRGYNAAAVQEPASYLAKRAYTEQLKNPGKYVIATGGGSGAGKSTALKGVSEYQNLTGEASLILDSNLSSLNSAIKKIKEAETAGKKFVEFFTYRDPREAFEEGVVKRMLTNKKEMGRLVPSKVVAQNHIDSLKVARELENSGLKVYYIDNSLGAGKARVVSFDELVGKAKDTNVNKLKGELDLIAKKLYDKKTITKEQYEGYIQ